MQPGSSSTNCWTNRGITFIQYVLFTVWSGVTNYLWTIPWLSKSVTNITLIYDLRNRKKKNVAVSLKGAWRQDEMIGGKPPVAQNDRPLAPFLKHVNVYEGEKNIYISWSKFSTRYEAKNRCAGEDQQKFNR
jgi:hypothetical protein